MPRAKKRAPVPEPVWSDNDSNGSEDEVVNGRRDSLDDGSGGTKENDSADFDKKMGLLYEPEVLDAIFTGLPVGCIILDVKGVVSAFSAGAERQFLYKAWEVIGENVIALMPEHVAVRHDFYISRCRNRVEKALSTAWVARKAEKEKANNGDGSEDANLGDPAASRAMTLNDVRYGGPEIQEFAAEVVAKQLMFGGQPREVGGIDKAGNGFPLEVQVFAILAKKQLYFMGFSSDLRAVSEFQMLTVAQEQLLESLLDERTVTRIMKGEKKVFDKFEMATVAMISISNYREKANAITAEQQVELLNEVFGMFGNLLRHNHSIELIKTNGETLMAASGVPVAVEDHATAMVECCLDFLQSLALYNHRVALGQSTATLLYSKAEQKRMKNAESTVDRNNWRKDIAPLQVRIGLHSGHCIGGVLSRLKGFYDLTGETISWSTRLCDACPNSQVHMSEATWKELSDDLAEECERKTNIDVPGLPKIVTYTIQ